jgi:hypothetical protein
VAVRKVLRGLGVGFLVRKVLGSNPGIFHTDTFCFLLCDKKYYRWNSLANENKRRGGLKIIHLKIKYKIAKLGITLLKIKNKEIYEKNIDMIR